MSLKCYIKTEFHFFLLVCSIVIYEGGSVMSQARSLWRLELARTKWAGGFINWSHPMRIRHITTGRYLAVNENNELYLVSRLVSFAVKYCWVCLKVCLGKKPLQL